MTPSSSYLYAIASVFLLLLSGTLPAQSPIPSNQTVIERQQKVFNALRSVGVLIPQDPASETTFLSLMAEMKRWAELPDTEPLADLDNLIGDTFPTPLQRWGRFNQFKVEGQEQPRTVLAYPSPTSTMTVPILNPDHVLFKYTVTSKASEFFPTTQDVADQIKSYTDAGGTKIGPTAKVLCRLQKNANHTNGPEEIASCLTKTRRRDIFYRFVSGYSGTFSYSDNPQVVQNIVIPSGTAAASQNRLFSGEVVFDPSNVFLTGTDWKNLSSSKGVYDEAVQKHVMAKVAKRCPGIDGVAKYIPTSECLARLSGPTGWNRIAAAILPTVDYKVQTQFDFIKSGANFVVPPYPLGHLYDFSFTQDFRRVFPTGKQREDAIAAIAAFSKRKNSGPANQHREAILIDFKRLALDESRLIDDNWYYKFLDEISSLL